MPFVPATNVMRAAIELLWAGQRVVNVLNFLKPGAVTGPDLVGMANALHTWWTTYIKPLTSADAALQTITVTDQSNPSAESFVLAISPPEVGSDGAGSVPNNVAVVCTLRTLFRGRSYRGRVYFPALKFSHLEDNNHVFLATATGIAAAYANLSTVEAATVTTHVIVSRFANHAPRATALMTLVDNYVVDPTVDSQRRRLPLRGD